MNKRVIAFFPILSLFLSTLLIPANAAAKAGGHAQKLDLQPLHLARHLHALNLARN